LASPTAKEGGANGGALGSHARKVSRPRRREKSRAILLVALIIIINRWTLDAFGAVC
jgi:hypothetical protein